MVKPIILANALTTVSLGLYVVCRVLTLVVPDLIFNIGQSWFHTFSIDTLQTAAPFDAGTFIFGAVTLGIITWATTYLAAALYNNWSK